jgi:hypothetical protein
MALQPTFIMDTADHRAQEMCQKDRPNPALYQFKLLRPPRTLEPRPLSAETVFVDSDEEIISEDEEEETDESPRHSLKSVGGPSIKTIDSYEEVATPHSSTQFFFSDINGAVSKSVQGPRGPHLFRTASSGPSSATSSRPGSLDENLVLSLSPLTPNNPKMEDDIPIAFPIDDAEYLHPPQRPSPRPTPPVRFSDAYLDESTLSAWEPEMVAQWLLDAGVEAQTAARFIENDVNGPILLNLRVEDLKELDIRSFGVRTRVWQHVCHLKETWQAAQQAAASQHTARNATGSRAAVPYPVVPPSAVTDARSPTPIQDTPMIDMHKQLPTPLDRTRSFHAQRQQSEPPQQPQQQPPSPTATPSRRRTNRRAASDHHNDIISPLESVSIVGIEAVMPKPHHCSKGENCATYQRRARRIEAFMRQFPDADMAAGKILIGNPGNPETARALDMGEVMRPMSDAQPSVVASSDVLGPGPDGMQLKLHEATLRNVAMRDPQDNVRQFLQFQHQNKDQSPTYEPPTPPFHVHGGHHYTEGSTVSRFSTASSVPVPGSARNSVASAAATTASTVRPTVATDSPLLDSSAVAPPRDQSRPVRQALKLSIPGQPASAPARVVPSSSAGLSSPATVRGNQSPRMQSPIDACSPIDHASPVDTAVPYNGFNPTFNPYRFGTPFSEMDVPVTAVQLGPVARDASQSVPPDMIYRSEHHNQQQQQQQQMAPPSRSMSRASVRRPSFGVLPPLDENKVSSVTRTSPRNLRPPPRFQYPWSPIEPRQWEQCLPPAVMIPTETSFATSGASGSSSAAYQGHKKSKSTSSTFTVETAVTNTFTEPMTTTATAATASTTATTATTSSTAPAPKDKDADLIHAGHMKKRKTKFLRHEWQDGFFTLRGTRLAMHPTDSQAHDARRTLEYIDVDDYAIACSNVASSSKLRAAFRAVQIAHSKGSKDDAGAFSFQLIPARDGGSLDGKPKRRGSSAGQAPPPSSSATGLESEGVDGTGKTHHFAVRSRDERIDWMRELMLAKALRQKTDGFEISRNGNMI